MRYTWGSCALGWRIYAVKVTHSSMLVRSIDKRCDRYLWLLCARVRSCVRACVLPFHLQHRKRKQRRDINCCSYWRICPKVTLAQRRRRPGCDQGVRGQRRERRPERLRRGVRACERACAVRVGEKNKCDNENKQKSWKVTWKWQGREVALPLHCSHVRVRNMATLPHLTCARPEVRQSISLASLQQYLWMSQASPTLYAWQWRWCQTKGFLPLTTFVCSAMFSKKTLQGGQQRLRVNDESWVNN